MSATLVVERLHVASLGALRDVSLELGPGATVVLGENEAGKSSVQEALRTLLFGFAPAQLARHPYRPRGGDGARIEVAGRIALGDERTAWARVLDGTGARVEREGDTARGNAPVAPGTTSALFANVHCVGPDDLAAYTARPGARLRALLLGDAEGEERVGAARAAVERERALIRRSTRRGNPAQLDAIDAQLQEVAAALRGARATEDALLDLERAARDDRRSARRADARATRLEERRAALELCAHVAALVQRAGVDRDVDVEAPGLSAGDALDPAPLLLALEEAEEDVEAHEARLAEDEVAPAPGDAAALGRGVALERTIAGAEESARALQRAHAARGRAVDARARAAGMREELGASIEADAERVSELAALATAWSEAVEGPPAPPRGVGLGAALGVGALGAAAAFASGDRWIAAGSALAAPVAVALLARRRGDAARGGGAAEEREVRGAVRAAGLPLHHARTASVALRAARRLQDSLEQERVAEGHDAEAAEAHARADAWAAEALTLAAELGVEPGLRGDSRSVDPHALARALERRHDDAQERAARRTADSAERERAADGLERARERAAHARDTYGRAERTLRGAVPGEARLDRAWERLRRARDARASLASALTALAASQAAAWASAEGTAEFDAALAGEGFDAASLAEVEAELREARAERASFEEAHTRAAERLRVERPSRSVSELVSDRAALLDERRAALDAYDRLTLIAATLAEGERRHRAQHVPRVLGRAGRLLARATADRWSEIALEGDGDGRLVVRGAGGEAVVAAPLSRGAREQVHLCLRIAAAEELDEAHGGGRLPLLLDEVFAHWDGERRARGWRLLAEVAEERQVVVFTCHAPWAEEAARALVAPLRRL